LDMMSIEDVLDILAVPLLGVVQEDEQVIISSNLGEPLALGKYKSPAGVAYGNIARRIRGEEVPIPDINKPAGFIDRLGDFLSTKII
ncbi:Septum site-determining protein MinD, partial [Candidatus Synechococcus spongiarum]